MSARHRFPVPFRACDASHFGRKFGVLRLAQMNNESQSMYRFNGVARAGVSTTNPPAFRPLLLPVAHLA